MIAVKLGSWRGRLSLWFDPLTGCADCEVPIRWRCLTDAKVFVHHYTASDREAVVYDVDESGRRRPVEIYRKGNG